jgi:hypothetical protein
VSDAPDDKITNAAASFRRVADKIDLNAGNGFGGAFVIVAPDGLTMDALLLDNDDAKNPAMFWGLLKARAEVAIAEIDDAQRRGGFGGGGYR